MEYQEVVRRLKREANPGNVAGMARFGINPEGTLGICTPDLMALAKKIGRDHFLSQELWSSGIHEAKVLAAMVDEPSKVTEKQMERWVKEFDSWDVCDQVCMRLFDKTPFAYDKVVEWSGRKEEFVKRAGFALMATLAVHDKKADDSRFEKLLPIIARESVDERNYVRKAVNWALRQIGKRNKRLNSKAIKAAEKIGKMDSKSARWIASDALRELKSEAVKARLR
jgi:3-methyladenine DNA glycosylase AlkD